MKQKKEIAKSKKEEIPKTNKDDLLKECLELTLKKQELRETQITLSKQKMDIRQKIYNNSLSLNKVDNDIFEKMLELSKL